MTVLACPVCGSHQDRDYDALGFAVSSGLRFRIVRCRAHRIGFADAYPQHGLGGVQPALDDLYGELRADRRDPRSVDFMDRVTRVASRPGVLHDVGSGNGQLMSEAKRRGWRVQGNDVVPSVRPEVGMTFFVGTLPDLNLAPESCDVVTSYCVIPHCIDPRAELTAEFSLLKSGGWLIAELPSDGVYRRAASALYRVSGGRLRSILAQIYQPGGHQFTFDPRSIRILLEAIGYEPVRVEPFFVDVALSVARFRSRPHAERALGTLAVYAMALFSRLSRRANHMIVFARKP